MTNCSHCPNHIDRKTFFHLCRKCRGIPDMKHNYEQRKLGKYVGKIAASFINGRATWNA